MSAHQTHDDSTLLNDFCATRSEAAFTELVRQHLPLVFHVALRRLGSAALAEEAAQHAFTRLAAKAERVARHPERLRAWLHRTAYFEASTLARKESRLSRLPIVNHPIPEPMNRPEIYDRLDELLNKLPELDRELVIRHCCAGEDYRRMAAAVGKSEAACQKRVERALARLGQNLGGPQTTGVVFAAFAATSIKAQAMPAAERVAAAALKSHGVAGGVAGAISGTKLAACAAIAMAGGVAGWQPEAPQPEALPPEITRSASPRRAAAANLIAITDTTPLAPRPVRIDRSLGEVLETINTGRLAPLVEFLQQATVAELRAIIAEDDIYEYGEQDGKEHFSTARNLALLRWAEIDPASAFQWAYLRDSEMWGTSFGESAAVLTKWLQADPVSAVTALGTLHLRHQVDLTQLVLGSDPDAANQIAVFIPRLAWVVEGQSFKPSAENQESQAEKIVSDTLKGNVGAEPVGNEAFKIRNAFFLLFRKDPSGTLARAKRVPWRGLRSELVAGMYGSYLYPGASVDLARGPLRHEALVRESAHLMATDPEAAISNVLSAAPGPDRDALFQGMAEILAGSDPWRLLEIVTSQDPKIGISFDMSRVLQFAGRTDPRRALQMVPALTARANGTGTTRRFAESILAGWVETDPEAAIRWAANVGIRISLRSAQSGPHPLIDLLSDPSEDVRQMAREALYSHVADANASGDAKALLARMPQADADEMVTWLSSRLFDLGPAWHKEALQASTMATPETRLRRILPDLALQGLQNHQDQTVTWINDLPAADRHAIFTGVDQWLAGASPFNETNIRPGLNRINR